MQTVGKGLVIEPCSGKGVSLDYEKQRIEVYRFKAGAVQSCKVETGAIFRREYLVLHTNALSSLVARGRSRIGDVLLLQSCVDGSHLHFDDVLVTGLISRKGGRTAPFLHICSGSGNYLLHLRVIGSYECSRHFRHEIHTCPLVIGEELYRIHLRSDDLAVP